MQPCRYFSRGNKSTCTHRTFRTLFSHCFLKLSWCSLNLAPKNGWKDSGIGSNPGDNGARQNWRLQPQCSSGDSKWAAGTSLRKWWVLPQRSHFEGHAGAQETRSSLFSWVAWAVQWIRGLRCLSSTIFFRRNSAPCRFIWILGGRK